MFDHYLEPIDTCGCGDIGYLTTRTLPIDLAHGVGKVFNVPVYHCRSEACPRYTIPVPVSRRLDDIAETMENNRSLQADYNRNQAEVNPMTNGKPAKDENHCSDELVEEKNVLVQAFTLKFVGRSYEDASILNIIPGEAIFLQSKIDSSEYYVLRLEPDINTKGETWFSFSKFYSDEESFDYETFYDKSKNLMVKELAVITMDEIELTLADEFGEIQ